MSVIPLGIVGAVLALLITSKPLSFVAIIGLIALAGVAVKSSILLVDFTSQLREKGKSVDDAITAINGNQCLNIRLEKL